MYLSVETNGPSQFAKIEDRFDEVYDSYGEPGPFCDMEYLEDTQYFGEDALPTAPPPPDAGDNDSDDEDNESVVEVGGESNNDSSPPVHVIP